MSLDPVSFGFRVDPPNRRSAYSRFSDALAARLIVVILVILAIVYLVRRL